jgi:hypothetical protein
MRSLGCYCTDSNSELVAVSADHHMANREFLASGVEAWLEAQNQIDTTTIN